MTGGSQFVQSIEATVKTLSQYLKGYLRYNYMNYEPLVIKYYCIRCAFGVVIWNDHHAR